MLDTLDYTGTYYNEALTAQQFVLRVESSLDMFEAIGYLNKEDHGNGQYRTSDGYLYIVFTLQ